MQDKIRKERIQGRPKRRLSSNRKSKLSKISVRDELFQLLRRHAETRSISITECVNRVIEDGLAHPRDRQHNQTKTKWLEGLDPEQLGTGVFLIPDVQSEQFGAARSVLAEGITYSECISRGQFTIAFQWVPHSLKSYEELLAHSCDVG